MLIRNGKDTLLDHDGFTGWLMTTTVHIRLADGGHQEQKTLDRTIHRLLEQEIHYD